MKERDVQRLGPSAQNQIRRGLQGARAPRTGKNKYNARKTRVRMPDGSEREFASAKEAARWQELCLMMRAGEIEDLRCQVPFELIPAQVRPDGTREQPVRYIADFVYRDGCRVIVEDVKGFTDTGSAAYQLYTVKRKLMLWRHKIAVREV